MPAYGNKKPEKKSLLGRLVILGVVVCLGYVLGTAGIVWYLIGGSSTGLMTHPKTQGVDVGEVEFVNAEGMTLRGWYSPVKERPVILMAHGRGGHRTQFSPLYTFLFRSCRLGFLTFDFRGAGLSDGFWSTGGIREAEDLKAAIDWLVQKKNYSLKDIGIVAFDMGALAALRLEERLPKLGAIVLVAPSESPVRSLKRTLRRFYLPVHPTATIALAAARKLAGTDLDPKRPYPTLESLRNIPLLMVGGEEDQVSPPPFLRGLYQRIPGEAKTIRIHKGIDHAGLLSADHPSVTKDIAEFLSIAFR